MSQEVVDGLVSMKGYEQITVTTSANATLNSAKFRNATCAVIRVSGSIRYTLDSDNADLTLSTSVGMPWDGTDGDLVVPIQDLSKFAMRAVSANVTADCLYIIR